MPRSILLVFLFLLPITSGCQRETATNEAEETGDAPMDVDVVHPDNIPAAPVISAQEALLDFEVEDGFEVQLVASEPQIVDPVAMVFDEDGAMWVVEMRDYMWTTEGDKTGEPAGRIVVLRDEDGDGHYESSSVFLDHIYLPRAISIYNGGVLVAIPPNLFFVERNGYEAGEMIVVDSVYAVGGNPEHQPNGLLLSMDNWIYNAKSDQRYRYQDGKWLKELTQYRGQWGITQDDWGRLFYNNNSQTLLGDDTPPNVVAMNPHHEVGDRRVYGPSRASNRTYPRRVTPGANRAYRPATLDDSGRLVNVTSATGPVIYRGDNFPEAYRGNAFVQETVANLVKRVVLSDEEGVVRGAEPYENREFLTATDERFRPVNAYTAPDGSLYILDMYRGVVQHSTYLTDYLKNQIESRGLAAPVGLGRIYRIKWKATSLGEQPSLSGASNTDLVRHLTHANGWWRDTAQRLLIERGATEMQTALEVLATGASDPRTRIHALYTLEGLGRLSISTLELASRSGHSKVRGAVVTLAAQTHTARGLNLLRSMSRTSSPEDAAYIASAVAAYYGSNRREAWGLQVSLANRHADSPRVIDAILGTLEDEEDDFLTFARDAGTSSDRFLATTEQAAGMALLQAMDGVRLLPAEFIPSFERGREVYTTFCGTCHGRDGNGMTATAPPMIRSQWVLQDTDRLIRLVMDGIEGPVEVDGKTYTAPDVVDHMPGVRDTPYSNQDIADALTFARNEWGNQAGAVTSSQVAAVRNEGAVGAYTADALRATETDWTPLVQPNSLEGWTLINGSAEYSVQQGEITGMTVMNSPNSFLATDRTYANFILELEFNVDSDLNSGVQIRSNSLPDYRNGRVHGYQIEIDPSDRAWTAGLYDEGRRGWLFDLSKSPKARSAFKQNEWNHFRIEARGDHIRTWLNGVLATDILDSMTSEGFIALQVHSIRDASLVGKMVRWRNIKIRELD